MKLNKIVEGWKNHLIPKEEDKDFIELTSKERIKICEQCSFHSKNHLTVRPDAHCTHCGCPLITKTKCLTCECPISKWTAIIPEK